MMRWRMRVLALAGLASACAAPLPPAPSAAAGPPVMGPVNILMGDGFAADPRRQAELDYVRGQIEASGVFAPAPPGAARPPVTLVVDYQQGDISLAQSAGAVAAAATMFLVPHQETVDFTLHVSFLTAGTAVPPRSYTAT